MLEKKQVISFLKILKIPADRSPAEIESALVSAGWHLHDAKQAVAILHPDEGRETAKPQVVAQVFSAPQPIVPPPTAASDEHAQPKSIGVDAPTSFLPQVPSFAHMQEIEPTPTPTAPAPVVASEQMTAPSAPAVSTTPVTPPPPPPVSERPAPTQPAMPSASSLLEMEQIFRSDGKLRPETIQNLLGIDVDVSMDDIDRIRSRRQGSLSFWQFFLILISAIAIAFAALLYGMYLFKVGPFHHTVSLFS